MATHINSNGSKWAGQAPDSIETLIKVLNESPLDRVFEMYGNFIKDRDDEYRPGMVNFFGNFFTLSHVFNIDTDDAETIEALTSAIRANQQRSDYLSQQDPWQAEREEEERQVARMMERHEQRVEEAKRTLGLA